MLVQLGNRLDFSAFHSGRARRFAQMVNGAKRLEILRRLQRQYVACDLPKLSRETRIEQSFNEQFFGGVLGYQTLFSSESSYHLEPKLPRGGRTGDFSLGFFGPSSQARIVVSAELKDPGADLDKAQGGGYGKITPVQQAFRAAKAAGDCEWIVVSNFRELRLYHCQHPKSPVAVFDLFRTQSAYDLSGLLALFDRQALLGTPQTEAELTSHVNSSAPDAIIAAEDNSFRLVFRFVPVLQDSIDARCGIPLSLLESTIAFAVGARVKKPIVRSEIIQGWCIATTETEQDGTVCCFGASRLGERMLSARLPLAKRSKKAPTADIDLDRIVSLATDFAIFADMTTGSLAPNSSIFRSTGFVSGELRDVTNTKLKYFREETKSSIESALTTKSDIFAGDFHCFPAQDIEDFRISLLRSLESCIEDWCIQYRTPEGGMRFGSGELERQISLQFTNRRKVWLNPY